ncbi:Protein IDA-LIKE [Arachis hypogaea]|uniref:Protein IDA-LIKE n=1 Tax=Arachis hypogaea TaxID=3818 RepID=A0A445BCN5_ARAHY|nr:Protein IDA-LIKE [Arachis hypogaea]RYR36419.1 hypothetical protein Ahy_A09g041378 [Arachis hypogaea]
MSNSSSHSSIMLLLLVYFLLLSASSSDAIRTLPTITKRVMSEKSTQLSSPHTNNQHQLSPYKGMVFNFFPKGMPVPPSGPSKRHNSVVDSTPHN